MIIGTMTVAIQKVHGKNGLWLTAAVVNTTWP